MDRHHPVVVQLEYLPEAATHTLLFSGKGITYDTGGADIKVGGHMAGMSRDKVRALPLPHCCGGGVPVIFYFMDHTECHVALFSVLLRNC